MTNLARIRIARGLSQRQLAAQSNVHHIQIAKLESGERPIANIRLSTAIALADALGVDVRELMDAEIPEDR